LRFQKNKFVKTNRKSDKNHDEEGGEMEKRGGILINRFMLFLNFCKGIVIQDIGSGSKL